MKGIIREIDQKTHERRRKDYYDRGHLYQHLLTNEMKRNRKLIADYFWDHGKGNHHIAFKSLRNRVGFLLAENGLLRGENICDLQLPDFFCIEMEGEGPSDAMLWLLLRIEAR